jgi:hypothetical protein
MPLPAAAQRLTGSVTDAASREPILLALVALVDASGAVVQQVLTNETGRFVMAPRVTGRVRLRIERIGYAPAHEPFFELGPDMERDFAIAIRVQPITLEGIAVSDVPYCSINESASETLRVWTEARKALAAAMLAERQRIFRFNGVTFQRDVTEDGTITALLTRPFMQGYRQPFVSLPAADLAQNGYVRRSAGDVNFYGPNAEVLLSAEFEATNCFSLTRDGDRPDLIGVRFAPNRRHEAPAIRGIVWLDTRSASLRFVEFEYVNTDRFRYADLGSGRVEFQMLPNGGWFISQWWIRMPLRVQTGRRARALTFREEGGEVRAISMGAVVWSTVAGGAIAGVAIDSTSGRPLPDARVALAGSAVVARTDAHGFFRISNLPPGNYALTLTHPRLDSLPAYAHEPRAVQVETGDTTRVTLAIPPLERSTLAPCLATMQPFADRMAVYGAVRAEATGEPVPHVRLRFAWDSIFAAAGELRGAAHRMELETDERGRYIACDLPGGMTIRAEVLAGDRPPIQLEFHTGYPTARVDGRSIMYRPLLIPHSTSGPAVRAARTRSRVGDMRAVACTCR